MKEHCDTHLDQEVQETIENKEFHVVDSSDIGGNENAKIDGMQEICHTMTMKKCERRGRWQQEEKTVIPSSIVLWMPFCCLSALMPWHVRSFIRPFVRSLVCLRQRTHSVMPEPAASGA